MSDKLSTSFLTASLTATFALILLFVGEWWKWHYRRQQEANLLRAVVDDLVRHLDRGLDRLEEIIPLLRTNNSKPSILHIKKLRVDEKSPIFSDENLRYLELNDARRVATMRFRIRNFNMDCDFAVEAYAAGSRKRLLEILEYVERRNKYLKFQIEQSFHRRPSRPDRSLDALLTFETDEQQWSKEPF